MFERTKFKFPDVFSKATIPGAHSLYPTPFNIWSAGFGPPQLFHVSITTFNPFANCGIPTPPPDTNPVGGLLIKQKAKPSAAFPPKIRKSYSTDQLVQTLKLIGVL